MGRQPIRYLNEAENVPGDIKTHSEPYLTMT
jgi:hypothetical protein